MKITLVILTFLLAACGNGGDDEGSTSSVEAPKYHVAPEPSIAPAKPNCSTTYPC